MSTNEIILALVCAVLVVFSLTVALVVPKRNPSFPRSLLPYFLVVGVLVAGMLTSIEVLGAEEEPAEAAAPSETGGGGGETGAQQPGQQETGGGGGGGAAQGDPAAGKAIFTGSAGCHTCHTLADAGASGTIGPNLDQAKPPYDLVIDRVTHGKGVMPAFGDQGTLNEKQIQDVAAYVVQATSG